MTPQTGTVVRAPEGEIAMRRVLPIVIVLACGQPVGAETLLHPAENKVPVAIVRLERTPRFTEIHIETQAARSKVCWASSGSNSPYLLANGRRHRFIDGDAITSCPATRDYGARETMVLRFEPLDPQVREFSLVEGEGGENQMIDPASSRGSYWNFLHVKSQPPDAKPQKPDTKPTGPAPAGR
jgi:hypothetical protein